MAKKYEIFFPEDIEFDMTPIGLQKYYMPGDIPVKKVLKLFALDEKDKADSYQETIDLIIELFSLRHEKKELKKLKDNLGSAAVAQIVAALYKQIGSAVGEIKNMKKAREKKQQ